MRFLSALVPVVGAAHLFASPAPAASAAPVQPPQPPLRLWMNNDGRFREGDYVRVQVDAETSGFLLVLQYDPFGRVRVLFPLDPRDDNRVIAGRRYEVREEAGRFAFRAEGDGPGLIYSAIARDPWNFDEIVRDGRWDYDRLALDRRSEDPEAELTELVQRLAGPGGFDYDVQDYRVYGESGRSTTVVYHDYFYGYGPYGYCDWYWGAWGCPGFRLGLSFGYDPYGYGYYFGSPYRGYYGYPYYFPRYPVVSVPRVPRAVVSGRPRNYTVTPVRPRAFGTGAISRPAGPQPAIDWRHRTPSARPVRPARSVDGREFRPDSRVPARDWSRPERPEPRSRPSAERGTSSGRRDGGNTNGGGQVRGNSGGGQAGPPPARSRPRRP